MSENWVIWTLLAYLLRDADFPAPPAGTVGPTPAPREIELPAGEPQLHTTVTSLRCCFVFSNFFFFCVIHHKQVENFFFFSAFVRTENRISVRYPTKLTFIRPWVRDPVIAEGESNSLCSFSSKSPSLGGKCLSCPQIKLAVHSSFERCYFLVSRIDIKHSLTHPRVPYIFFVVFFSLVSNQKNLSAIFLKLPKFTAFDA